MIDRPLAFAGDGLPPAPTGTVKRPGVEYGCGSPDCADCYEKWFAQIHRRDEDCRRIDAETGCCVDCGVDHSGEPCGGCGQRAFHAAGCPASDEASV